jgi:four helix bundle protein
MPFKFEKLEIWKLAIEFADEVHLLTRRFPKEEIFSLTSQFKRAADSVSLNIAEGFYRPVKPRATEICWILHSLVGPMCYLSLSL